MKRKKNQEEKRDAFIFKKHNKINASRDKNESISITEKLKDLLKKETKWSKFTLKTKHLNKVF